MKFDPTEHPHRRFNPLTGEYIFVPPHRTKRPWQGQVEKRPRRSVPLTILPVICAQVMSALGGCKICNMNTPLSLPTISPRHDLTPWGLKTSSQVFYSRKPCFHCRIQSLLE
jgi:hypothetical protein